MTIQYLEPFSRGFERMKKALFNPFDIKKWFVVGFTAFLSGLTDCHSGGSGSRSKGAVDWEDILFFPQRAWEWLSDHPVWAMAIAFGVVALFVLGVLIMWWSARGKFMFLDNIVHDRSQVIAPWNEFKVEGNSLFIWMLALGAIFMTIFALYIVPCIISLQAMYESVDDIRSLLAPAIMWGLGLFGIVLIVGFIDLLLYDFVVLIMYRDRAKTLPALQKFWPLFLTNFPYFLGYALFRFVVIIVVIIGVALIGLATCCVGFVFLAIPYINSVVLLPISYTMRAFNLSFFEQFGPEFAIFPKPETAPPAADTPAV